MNDKRQVTWEESVVLLRSDPANRELVKSCFFDDPAIAACERYHASSEWTSIQKTVGEGRSRSVLDVGAGRGIASYAFAKDGWKVTALEPDPSAVVGAAAIREIARSAGLEIEVVETWGEKLPFPDNSFDLAFCRQVLHHAADLNAFCQEIGRVLVPGGMLLAIREHVISKAEDLPVFLNNHPLHSLYGGEHAYLLSEYTASIEGGKLRLVSILNPFSSDMNIFPGSHMDIKRRFAAKLKFPWPELIPDALVRLLGNLDRTPGRLYSFVAIKPV